MSIKFVCPNGHRLVVPDHRAGKKGRCPVCHQRLYVPEPVPKTSHRPKRQPDPFELEQYAPEEEEIEVDIEFEAAVTPVKPPAEPQDDLERALLEELGIDPESSSPRFPPPPLPTAARQQPPAAPQSRTLPSQPAPVRPVAPLTPYTSASHAAPIAAPLPTPIATSTPLPTAYPAYTAPVYAPAPAPVNYSVRSMTAGMASPALQTQRTLTPPSGWFALATPETIGWGEHASGDWLGTTYVLAGMTAGAAFFSLGPAIHDLAVWNAPQWAQIVIGVALLQVTYALWLVTIPDWVTLRLGMLLNSLIAALFAGGFMIVLSERSSPSLPLDLGDVRNTAGGWCAAQMTVSGVLCYAYHRSSLMWRRSWRREHMQHQRSSNY